MNTALRNSWSIVQDDLALSFQSPMVLALITLAITLATMALTALTDNGKYATYPKAV